MAIGATVYRFGVKVSDVDRGFYQDLELRLARHPSESPAYLFTRVIACALNHQEGISFTEGIASNDEPAILVRDLTGAIQGWIEVGNPSARRLHRATKTARLVRIYTYRDPAILCQELEGAELYRRESIELFALAPAFLQELEGTLERDNQWELLHDQGELSVVTRQGSVHGELRSLRL